MKKPTLVIMAAGMGSRYGGLKQIDPVDEQGHIIMMRPKQDLKRLSSLLKRRMNRTFGKKSETVSAKRWRWLTYTRS